jgi:hypothetical protein
MASLHPDMTDVKSGSPPGGAPGVSVIASVPGMSGSSTTNTSLTSTHEDKSIDKSKVIYLDD